MKRLMAYLFLFNVLLNCGYSQEIIHNIESLGGAKVSTTTNIMTERIKQSARRYEEYAPIPRIAMIDYAFAKDLEEYEKLNGYGILYISSLNQDYDEYPITSVYFQHEDMSLELLLIGFLKIPVKDKITKKVFGKNRIDYYYLLPYLLTLIPGQIMIDWNKNRKEFVVLQCPAGRPLDYFTEDTPILPDFDKEIDMISFENFAKREYQIKFKK